MNYEMLSEDEVFEKYGVRPSEEKFLQSEKVAYKWYMRPLLYGMLIPTVFCKKDYAVVDGFFDRKEMYFRYLRVIHKARENKYYVTDRNLRFVMDFIFCFKDIRL